MKLFTAMNVARAAMAQRGIDPGYMDWEELGDDFRAVGDNRSEIIRVLAKHVGRAGRRQAFAGFVCPERNTDYERNPREPGN